MDIKHAMLGLFNINPMTGYDIKKIMQNSPIIYWSGNNNQIYKALSSLLDEGFITSKILHEDSHPTKKEYTITEHGKMKLHDLSLEYPQTPEVRRPFLLQLIFAGNLTKPELESIIMQYENEVNDQFYMVKNWEPIVDNNEFTTVVNDLAKDVLIKSYEIEKEWIEDVKNKALSVVTDEVSKRDGVINKMKYKSIKKEGYTYVTVTEGQIMSEQDGVDLVAACAESGSNLLLLPFDCLSDDFLRLSTRLAGLVLQKLGNYNIKTAAVIDISETEGRLSEFLSEANRGNEFRTFASTHEAESWLTSPH
ncbi:MAG: DUF4180 domain-containing protein [Suipraeoptans sp.]